MRPTIVGHEQLQAPYPVYLQGVVSKGFGRGSKELGIPTANLPEEQGEHAGTLLETGIYFGWASVANGPVHPMVMSFGWNPYYKNEKRSAVFSNSSRKCISSTTFLMISMARYSVLWSWALFVPNSTIPLLMR